MPVIQACEFKYPRIGFKKKWKKIIKTQNKPKENIKEEKKNK